MLEADDPDDPEEQLEGAGSSTTRVTGLDARQVVVEGLEKLPQSKVRVVRIHGIMTSYSM